MSTDLRPDPDLAARAERTTPLMSLDPDALLGAAHRHVRRRTAARVAGGALAVAAVAVVGAQLAADRITEPDPAQPPTQVARPLGDGAVVEVADGLLAANRPGAKHAPDPRIDPLVDGATWQVDLGLTTDDHELVLGVGPVVDGLQQGAAYYSRVTASGTSDGYGGGVWTWGTPSVEDGVRLVAPLDSGEWSELVVVPTTMRDPHVLLWSTAGFEASGGSSVAVELPTFAAPDGQLLAAALGDPAVADSIQSGESGVVFVGSDGRVVQAPCADLPTPQCPTIDDVPGLAAAVAAVTSAPTAETAATTKLAEGVHATTSLARSSGDGWDAGLRITGSWADEGESGVVVLAPATEVELGTARDAFDVPATDGVRVRVSGLDGVSAFTWADDDSADRFPAQKYYPGSLRWDMNDDVRLLAGAVPRWLPNGRVVLWLPRGVVGNDGERVHALDVPTFADPTGSGSHLYAISLDEGVAMRDVTALRDALVLYLGEGTTADEVAEGSGRCTALDPACLEAQPDGGAALVAALAERGVDVADVTLGAGVTPPAGPSTAASVGEGITAATAWSDDERLDLGDIEGRRVWLELADGAGDVLLPTLYLDTTLPQTQPRQLDLTSMDGTVAPLAPDVRAFVEIGAAPQDGAWRAFTWSVMGNARGDLPVELPTVWHGDRAMYAYVATDASGHFDTLSTNVWVSPGGDVLVPGCEGISEEECEQTGGTPGIFADVRAALG